jgi:hypothetical protein
MTTITEYRDGYINQIGAPGSSFVIRGNVHSTIPYRASNNLININFQTNIGVSFINQSDFINNTCRMYWNCLGNSIEYDLIDQVFDKDIVVSKQLNYSTNTYAQDNQAFRQFSDDDAGTPVDYRFGFAGIMINNNNNATITSISFQLQNPNGLADVDEPFPEFFINKNILPFFDGLEFSIIKTNSANRFITFTGQPTVNLYHNNPTRVSNPASEIRFRTQQVIKLKIIKTGENTYGWHIMEGKTPAP